MNNAQHEEGRSWFVQASEWDARHAAGSAQRDGPAMQDPIIFIHIPKTAGTAFSHYLKENCADPDKVMEAFYGDYSIYDGATDVPVILGHTSYRVMSARFPAASFVTWLRHPLDRVVSQYKSWHNPKNLHQHWKDNVGDRAAFEHIYFTQNATFEEFAMSDDPRLLCHVANNQTRILRSHEHWSDRYEMLASAKENLERNFRFFGIVERFGESIELFKQTFGWREEFKDDDAKANRSTQHEVDVTDRARERIMQQNDLDLELYEFACRLFDQKARDVLQHGKAAHCEEGVAIPA